MASWIADIPRLTQGLKIANQVDSSKFRLLVSRICQGLQCGDDTRIFSEEEEEKLLISLDLNKEALTILLETIVTIYQQAACNMVKANAIDSLMKDCFNVDDEKVLIFSNAWVTYGKGIVENFRHRSLFPLQVRDIDWSLNVETSSSAISKDARPIALLQLSLMGEKNLRKTIEFDKRSLTELYQNLEKIQKQLDSLK